MGDLLPRLQHAPKPTRKPKGGRAVAEQCAGEVVEGDTPEQALHRKLNFFPTAPWATRAGVELVLALDPHAFGCRVAEPACGEGHMAAVLGETFQVEASDIHDFGYGFVCDYLLEDPQADLPVDWTFSNPPFRLAGEFIETALRRSRVGVAMFCRSNFRESTGRAELMARRTVEAPFVERVEMQMGGWNPAGSGQVAFSWFVWMHPEHEPASALGTLARKAREAGCQLTRPIPQGTKARLTRMDDARTWGLKSEGALL